MYSAGMLRKCAKLYKETAITVDNHLVKPIKKQALDPDTLDIEEIFSRDFNEEMDFQKTLKKLSILSHIYNRELQLYLQNNQGQALLECMFNGKFKDQ